MIRLSVRCADEQAELVLAELLQLAPNGVEEERLPEGIVEFAIYGAPGELPELGALRAAAGDGLADVRSEPVPDDWADRWRDFHEATVVADRVVIRPSWRPAADVAAQAPLDVVIEPGQAFGTGAHPTTRMCVELLVESADAGEAHGTLADLGTGSGVLAIVAAKLGWKPVLGVDSEPAAITAARANAAANRAAVSFERRNLREQAPPRAATVVANLTAPLLRHVAARLEEAPRLLVCSGLLGREADAVAGAFAERSLTVRARRDSGDWAALLLAAEG